MLLPTKNIHVTGNIVVLYYGFCVLQRLMDIKKKGVYRTDIINKRPYWTCYIYDKKINVTFIDKDVDAVDVLHGEIENAPLYVFDMKEEDYVIILMPNYGTNERAIEEKVREIDGERIT